MLRLSIIPSYVEFQQTFRVAFNHRRRERKDSSILLGVKQQTAEPLRDYLTCFSLTTQGVNELQDPAVVMALRAGLKDCSFMRSLARTLVQTLAEAREKAEKNIREEDAVSSKEDL